MRIKTIRSIKSGSDTKPALQIQRPGGVCSRRDLLNQGSIGLWTQFVNGVRHFFCAPVSSCFIDFYFMSFLLVILLYQVYLANAVPTPNMSSFEEKEKSSAASAGRKFAMPPVKVACLSW